MAESCGLDARGLTKRPIGGPRLLAHNRPRNRRRSPWATAARGGSDNRRRTRDARDQPIYERPFKEVNFRTPSSMPEAAPQPLFILCPSRSFSSVICGMLGQHPQCYALPELNLFLADDLGGLMRWSMIGPFLREGLLRTLAQLHEAEQNEDSIARAREWIAERTHWSVRQVFDYIQERVGPRMLIEKSPTTTLRHDYLRRLLRTFPQAKILHLVRHPRSTAESILNFRAAFDGLQRITQGRPESDPERMWRVCHESIIAVTNGLPLGQCMLLKGEAFLGELDVYLPQVCEWLGLDTDAPAVEAMMHPEHSPYAKLGPPSAQYGNDPNFLSDPRIDRERLRKIREPSLVGELSWRPGETFDPRTRRLAKQFGYQ